MNREVMGRQMFNQGGMVDPMMDQGMPMEPPMAPPMAPPGMADPEMEMAAQGAMENGLDPAELEGMLSNYSQNMDDLEGSENYETVINTIRGDEAPMEARYAELASMVGPEDAQATPESVLTLIQPVMLMNSMDQGIGSLAEEQMATPIEGPMAGGIMSTVDMAPPVDPMMAPPAGVPPVNFNQGGAVRGAVQYLEDGGETLLQKMLRQQDAVLEGSDSGSKGSSPFETQFNARRKLLEGIVGSPVDSEEDIQKEREMTQAQMLFDVAGTALEFATPGETQMSAGQRLAQAAKDTQLFEKIGARAREQQVSDKARRKTLRDEKMQLDLMAYQSADARDLAIAKARAARSGRASTNVLFRRVNKETGELDPGSAGFTVERDSPRYIEIANRGFKDEKGNALIISSPPAFTRSTEGNALQNWKITDPETGNVTYKSVRKTDLAAMREMLNRDDALAAGLASANDTDNKFKLLTFQLDSTGEVMNLPENSKLIKDVLERGFLLRTAPPVTKKPEASDDIRIMSDQVTLDAYADGTLNSSKVNELENLMGTTLNGSYKMVNGERKYVAGRELSGGLMQALQTRIDGNFTTTDFSKYLDMRKSHPIDVAADLLEAQRADANQKKKPVTTTKTSGTPTKQDIRDKILALVTNEKNPDTGFVPKDVANTRSFNSLLFDESGAVDFDSPAWRMLSPSIYNSKVDYNTAQGPSNAPARIGTYFGEIGQDLGLTDRVDEAGLYIYQADADFNNLKMYLQGAVQKAVTDGRVLKSLQDAINKNLEPLTPGLFRFDAKALATMNSVAGILKTEFRNVTDSLPEYGGRVQYASDAKMEADRASSLPLKAMLTELKFFTDDLAKFVSTSAATGSGNVGGASVNDQRKALLNLRNNGFTPVEDQKKK